MSRAGFFGSWKSQRYGFQLTFTRMFMACLFIAMMTFNAVMYVREDLRFELFGFENTWIYVCIAAELVILALLGLLSVNSYSLYCLEDECLQKESRQGLLHNFDREDIFGSLSARLPSSAIKSIDFLERLSTIESCLVDVICLVKDLQENQNESQKLLINTNDVLKSERELMRQMADKICQYELRGSEIRELKTLMDRKNLNVEEIKKLIKQLKDRRQSDSVEVGLFKGQLSQLLDRTEILDTIRAVIHKYAYLIDVSKGDLVEFLKIDDVLSQPVQVLNISREIANALVRNGLDRIECLTMHDASVISQKTRLGPKRMQMLEEALKSYAPELGFGMYKI
ncbi:MAG: hypothetical protein J5976_06450 [Bacteroidales bacterium]|nr:hypothetical protein [Bacteroidales bacterium]